MPTIKKMKEDVQILLGELAELKDIATQENRKARPEELEIATKKLDEIDELERCIQVEERYLDTIDKSKESDNEPDRPAIQSGKEERTSRDRHSNFASPGEFYRAVMLAGMPGGVVDQRLSTRAAAGLSEGVPSDGGFLVESAMANEILKNVWSSGMILPRVSKTTLSGNTTGMKLNGLDETSRINGSRAGGITAFWAAEAAEKTASKPKFRQIELTLNKLIGLCYATDELLQDANALAQTINEGFKDEFEFKITDAIINGTGAGQPLGILNSGCMVSVSKESGQVADSILFENLLKMWSRLMASSRPNSIWIINQSCEVALNQMSLAVGTGGVPVYLPSSGAAQQPYSTLFGRPVVPIEQCAALGDTGDIMLCDFSKYKMVDKGGMQSDVSIHVRFIYDESCFRYVLRIDGQPILSSAITPYKGTDTLSHFVKLNERA